MENNIEIENNIENENNNEINKNNDIENKFQKMVKNHFSQTRGGLLASFRGQNF
jgi:hypothetical protein